MVIEWAWGLMTGAVAGLLGLFPELPSISSAAGNIAGAASTISGYASGVGGWVPFGQIGTAVGVIFSFLVVSVVIKLTRIVISLLTVGGGSAG